MSSEYRGQQSYPYNYNQHQIDLSEIKNNSSYQMFNPKEALERIRKNKNPKEQQKTNGNLFNSQMNAFNPNQDTNDSQPLFPETSHYQSDLKQESVQNRLGKLQALVSQLGQQLNKSNDTVQLLKKQNSHLETQILKLQYQNSQLKSSSKILQIKQSHSMSKLNRSQNKLINSFNNDKNQIIKKAQSKVIEEQIYSSQVEQVLQHLKNQPVDNILKRKQHNFRALKNDSKNNIQKGNKLLKQLANLHKNYGSYLKKPVLILNLDESDFQ